MQYVRLAKIPRPVSRLLFGCAYPGMIAGEDQTALLDQAFAAGVNAIDTAENYGKSELILGAWMAERSNRDQLTIITKGCHPYGRSRVTPEDMRHDFAQSLERLRTDHVDVYMLHRDDPQRDVGEIMEALNEFVRAGQTLRIGASNWTMPRVREANAYAHAHGLEPFSVLSPNYSLARQIGDPWGGCTALSGEEHAADRAWCAQEGITVIAYAALGARFPCRQDIEQRARAPRSLSGRGRPPRLFLPGEPRAPAPRRAPGRAKGLQRRPDRPCLRPHGRIGHPPRHQRHQTASSRSQYRRVGHCPDGGRTRLARSAGLIRKSAKGTATFALFPPRARVFAPARKFFLTSGANPCIISLAGEKRFSPTHRGMV